MTLMELVVVMGLLSLLLFTVMPRFLRSDRITDADQAVRRLAALVSQLKEEAVLNGRSYILHVDVDGGRFWTTIGSDPWETRGAIAAASAPAASQVDHARAVLQLPESILRVTVRLLHAEPIDAGSAEIHFFPQGYSYGATILLEGRDGDIRCLRIEPFLGAPVILKDGANCVSG